MNKLKLYIIIVLSFVTIISCSSDDENDTYIGYEYFPVNVGHWIEYDVDSILKDEFSGSSDTFNFQIREVIDSVFINLSGDPTLRLERFKRTNVSDPWIIHKVWTSNINGVNAQKVEDNIRFVKLVFPVSLFTMWDGNAFNTNSITDYEYTSVHQPTVINGMPFDSAATVTQVLDTTGLISEVFELEKYATNVGMIFKQQINIEKDFVTDTIKSAKVYRETIIAYGN